MDICNFLQKEPQIWSAQLYTVLWFEVGLVSPFICAVVLMLKLVI